MQAGERIAYQRRHVARIERDPRRSGRKEQDGVRRQDDAGEERERADVVGPATAGRPPVAAGDVPEVSAAGGRARGRLDLHGDGFGADQGEAIVGLAVRGGQDGDAAGKEETVEKRRAGLTDETCVMGKSCGRDVRIARESVDGRGGVGRIGRRDVAERAVVLIEERELMGKGGGLECGECRTPRNRGRASSDR